MLIAWGVTEVKNGKNSRYIVVIKREYCVQLSSEFSWYLAISIRPTIINSNRTQNKTKHFLSRRGKKQFTKGEL